MLLVKLKNKIITFYYDYIDYMRHKTFYHYTRNYSILSYVLYELNSTE